MLPDPSRMIGRKTLALPSVMQQATPGNASMGGLTERRFIVLIKQRHYRSWRRQETFAGAACQHTLSLAKPNVPITRFQLRTVKSGSPPNAGRAHPCGSSVLSLETAFAGALPTFAPFWPPRLPCALPLRAALGNG